MAGELADGEGRVAIDGIAHWYRVAGARQRTTPLVVVHGGPGGNVFTFERTIGPQLERFATVVYYEQRGCGRSQPPADADAYSVPLLVADLDGLRAALGLDRIIPLGFSFGGELAAEYALAHPDRVERLILQAPSIASPLRTATQLMGFELVAEGELRQRVRAIARGPGTPEERTARVWDLVDTATVDRLLFHQAEAARLNRRLWQESNLPNTGAMHRALQQQPRRPVPLFDALPAIAVPTLVLAGLYDRNVGAEACRDVAASLPQAELVIFERSAHFPDIEEPERYAASSRRFLQPA